MARRVIYIRNVDINHTLLQFLSEFDVIISDNGQALGEEGEFFMKEFEQTWLGDIQRFIICKLVKHNGVMASQVVFTYYRCWPLGEDPKIL